MHSDKFHPTPLPDLLQIIRSQYDRYGRIFGIPGQLFFKPQPVHPYRIRRFGQLLETPIGVAAGPHTQLSQNIVTAWLTGARFIELKTIQTLDELHVSKPCIDMQDEGYNCEWSQELKITQSFDQYLNAWILIHVLKDYLEIGSADEPGFIFNMSVGYNLEGILQPNVQWFIEKMQNASPELHNKVESIKHIYPRVELLNIGCRISDNITLSTMHGCPPDEIEKIGLYLLQEKKLHTTIKLNPTLLGGSELRVILKNSGFETQVPDIAFEHDLKYSDALKIISSLRDEAIKQHKHFGIKLTNTLESANNKTVFSSGENMMYMSGRALHPISVGIAHKLQHDFRGSLDISFCGGADAFNVAQLVSCGLSPVTVCTDLLKPAGYTRLHQYLEILENEFKEVNASDLNDFIIRKSIEKEQKVEMAAFANLSNYADTIRFDEAYKKNHFRDPSIKTVRPLGWFDCIHAPCADTCPTNQDIPNYNFHTANGNFNKAAEVILQTNPFPHTTGMICDHLCQFKCTRINYDHPVMIREIKRFVAEQLVDSTTNNVLTPKKAKKSRKVAIVGAGPSGLSCANFLARAGFQVEVFESKARPGGMVASGIPGFRLPNHVLAHDIKRIELLGVKFSFGQEITKNRFEQLRKNYHYVYIAAGAQQSTKLKLPGSEVGGVIDPLKFLEDLKAGKPMAVGKRVLIIGGGNTAMDVARAVYRLIGDGGKVTIIYRRSIKEMPADRGEIKAVIEEGIEIIELAAPVRINLKNNNLHSMTCVKMHLGARDASGRPSPVIVPGSEFEINADTIIPAIGQEIAFDFGDQKLLRNSASSYETQIPGVFMGGDAARGASTAINAIGDGRKAAQEIIDREGIGFSTNPESKRSPKEIHWHMVQRAKRLKPISIKEIPLHERKTFKMVSHTISETEAKYEASRCLLCDELCNICATVCPNLALYPYTIDPISRTIERLVRKGERWKIELAGKIEIRQSSQIIHIADWCNHCGNCNTFCPSADAPYKIKPHLFLSEEAFLNENEGFWFERKKRHDILHQKANNRLSKLVVENSQLIYEFDTNKFFIDRSSLKINKFEITGTGSDVIASNEVVEMYVVYQGASSFQAC